MSDPMESSRASSTRRGSQSRRSSRTKTTTDTGISKSLSPYNWPFQQLFVDSHIYPPYYEHPDGTAAPKPKNLDYINEKLAQRRPSLFLSKFTKIEYKAFVRKDANATNENNVKKNVISSIQKTIKNFRTVLSEILFINLTPFTTDEKVTSGKPDFYHDARPEQLKRPVQKKLSHLIIPFTQKDLAILPSHFTAVKEPDDHAVVAKRQTTYNAYLEARGIHVFQNYGQAESFFDNKVYTFVFIYHNPTLLVFVCHPVQPVDLGKPPSYYMTPVGSFSMLHNVKIWKKGTTWYQNAIKLVKKWRNEFIRMTNNTIRAFIVSITSNASTSFVSTGNQLDALIMGSQVDDAANGSDEEFETAESSQKKEKKQEIVPSLTEQSSRPRR